MDRDISIWPGKFWYFGISGCLHRAVRLFLLYLNGIDSLLFNRSLRHQFQVEDSPINPLHGSDSPEAAEKEIQHFFPVQSTVAVIKPEVEPDKRGL